ncbi:hypothetical protein BZA77DRAFT_297052 [Pyronema omphalodes]|nr:hypothetical protein BZA77DRAFT_297052 [Pyronema omphalodes]
MTSAEIQRIIVIVGSTITSISTTFFIFMCIRSVRNARRRILDEERPRLILIVNEDFRRAKMACDARLAREAQREFEIQDMFNYDRATIAPTVHSWENDPDFQPICASEIPKARQVPARDCSHNYMAECRDDNHAHLRNTDGVKYCVIEARRADFHPDPPTPYNPSPIGEIAPWTNIPVKTKHKHLKPCRDRKHPHVTDPSGTKYCVLEVRKAIYHPIHVPAMPARLPAHQAMGCPVLPDTLSTPEAMEGQDAADMPSNPGAMNDTAMPAMPAPAARLLRDTVLRNMDDDENTASEERTKNWVAQYADPSVGRPDSMLLDPQTLAQYEMEPVPPQPSAQKAAKGRELIHRLRNDEQANMDVQKANITVKMEKNNHMLVEMRWVQHGLAGYWAEFNADTINICVCN